MDQLETWQAAILGAVQGLSEPLPISSSGHLVVVPWLFDWPDPGGDATARLGHSSQHVTKGYLDPRIARPRHAVNLLPRPIEPDTPKEAE